MDLHVRLAAKLRTCAARERAKIPALLNLCQREYHHGMACGLELAADALAGGLQSTLMNLVGFAKQDREIAQAQGDAQARQFLKGRAAGYDTAVTCIEQEGIIATDVRNLLTLYELAARGPGQDTAV
jgi:hypothetical protein